MLQTKAFKENDLKIFVSGATERKEKKTEIVQNNTAMDETAEQQKGSTLIKMEHVHEAQNYNNIDRTLSIQSLPSS